MKGLNNHLSFFAVMLVIFISSCTESISKERYIHNYEVWITTLTREYKGYKESDWVEAENEFKLYSETEYNKFKDDLTIDERQRVDQFSGQYYAILMKYQANKVQDEFKSIMNKAQGLFEELQKN